MKRGGGSAKGSAFERQICEMLSLWWTQDDAEKRDDIFWRTAGSGARATNRAKIGKRTGGQEGDISAIDPIGAPFLKFMCLELKRGYGQWSFLDLIDRKPSKTQCTAEKFWSQAVRSQRQSGAKYAGVIFRRDQKESCIMVNRALFSAACLFVGTLRAKKIHAQIEKEFVTVLLLRDFLDYLTPNAVRQILAHGE